MVKNPLAMKETFVQSLGWENSPEGGHGKPLQYSFLENPHGQRNLVGQSPWSHKESDTTERLSTAQSVIKLCVHWEKHFLCDSLLRHSFYFGGL